MNNRLKIFIVLIIILILCCLCILINHSSNTSQASKPENQNLLIDTNYIFQIKYNYPIEVSGLTSNEAYKLSGKTKKEIYEIRKKYVADSIFSNGSYEPSDEVFGKIEDNKPWLSNTVCKDKVTKKVNTTGPSKEARFITNPAILVAIEYPFLFSNYPNDEWCRFSVHNMIPDSVGYDGNKKEITVIYDRLPFVTKDSDFYRFNGINARDLGYKYVFLDKNKSDFNVPFSNKDNISNSVFEFQNHIHLDFSCEEEGGCNNDFSKQPYLEFKNPKTDYSKKNGVIYLKLWKHKPNSTTFEADITEKIIIRSY